MYENSQLPNPSVLDIVLFFIIRLTVWPARLKSCQFFFPEIDVSCPEPVPRKHTMRAPETNLTPITAAYGFVLSPQYLLSDWPDFGQRNVCLTAVWQFDPACLTVDPALAKNGCFLAEPVQYNTDNSDLRVVLSPLIFFVPQFDLALANGFFVWQLFL